jgi:large subunit ribosomal protein L24
MKEFSRHWKASSKPRKQRKYRFSAPLHLAGKFLNAHCSKEIAKKYGKRSIRVRRDDKVKIMRGKFKKKEGKVIEVDVKKGIVFIERIETTRKDGSMVRVPIKPNHLMIIELSTTDVRRMEGLSGTMTEKKNQAQTKTQHKSQDRGQA